MNPFRKERDAIQAKIDRIKAELAEKKQDRSEIANLPLPQSDFADLLCEKIDAEGRMSSVRLEQQFAYAKENYIELESVNPILEATGAGFKSGVIQPMHIYSLLGSLLKKPLHDLVMAWDWPKKVGPPRSERKAAIEKLDDQIEALAFDLENLISKAAADGMMVNI